LVETMGICGPPVPTVERVETAAGAGACAEASTVEVGLVVDWETAAAPTAAQL